MEIMVGSKTFNVEKVIYCVCYSVPTDVMIWSKDLKTLQEIANYSYGGFNFHEEPNEEGLYEALYEKILNFHFEAGAHVVATNDTLGLD